MKKENIIEGLIIAAILLIVAFGLATHNHTPKGKHFKHPTVNTNNSTYHKP